MSLCQLCENPGQLKDSHIIPKFIFKWLKETGSGYLRTGENFNIRVQDGPSHQMLCAGCEQLFGNEEKYFASKIFYPLVNENAESFFYDESLAKFVVSVVWRLIKHDFIPDEKDPSYLELLIRLESDYREFLLGKKQVPFFCRIHLLCGVDVRSPEEAEKLELPRRFIHYFARQVDAGVTGNQEHKFVYLKLPRMIFVIPIQGLPEQSFVNTRIDFPGGRYHLNQAGILEPLIGNYFYQRVALLDQQLDNLSARQKEKLAKATDEKWDVVQQKDLGKILNYQQELYNHHNKRS